MSLRIIEADYHNEAHGEYLLHLLDHYARDPMGDGKALSDGAKKNLIKGLQARPQAFSLLAFWDETAVGFATCFEGFSTFMAKPLINIHDLAVLKPYRGRGIARALLEAINDIGRSRGCCRVSLEVLEYNERAQKLYESVGFRGNLLSWQKPLCDDNT